MKNLIPLPYIDCFKPNSERKRYLDCTISWLGLKTSVLFVDDSCTAYNAALTTVACSAILLLGSLFTMVATAGLMCVGASLGFLSSSTLSYLRFTFIKLR